MAAALTIPQIVCQGDQCTPFPIPPFQPSPLQPPNNVLEIPVPQPVQGACDSFGKTSIDFLTDAIDDYANSAFPICGPPLRMRMGDCWAEVYGCPRFAGDETCGSGAYLGKLLSPANPGLPFAPFGGTVRHDTDPNYDQKVLDGTLDCAAPLIVVPPCKIPCWVSCAPELVQQAYCTVVNYSSTHCSISDALVCVGALALDILSGGELALTLTCLQKLLASCVAGEVVDAINALIGWLEVDPLACGCTPVVDPGCIAPEYAPPCNDGDCYTANGCCGPCDPPEPRAGGDPIEPGLTHSGAGGFDSIPPSSSAPVLATPGFFVSNPHSREATIPVVPVMIPHPECFACNSAVDELDELDEV